VQSQEKIQQQKAESANSKTKSICGSFLIFHTFEQNFTPKTFWQQAQELNLFSVR
jgi:hypothetical protein